MRKSSQWIGARALAFLLPPPPAVLDFAGWRIRIDMDQEHLHQAPIAMTARPLIAPGLAWPASPNFRLTVLRVFALGAGNPRNRSGDSSVILKPRGGAIKQIVGKQSQDHRQDQCYWPAVEPLVTPQKVRLGPFVAWAFNAKSHQYGIIPPEQTMRREIPNS